MDASASVAPGIRRLLREIREMAEELDEPKMIARIDALSDLVEELRRNELGSRKPDSKRIEALLSLLDYAAAVQTARKLR